MEENFLETPENATQWSGVWRINVIRLEREQTKYLLYRYQPDAGSHNNFSPCAKPLANGFFTNTVEVISRRDFFN